MGIIGVDLDKINIYYDNNFNKDDLKSIIHFRLFAWHIKFEKCKVFNKTLKRKELMSVGWHPKRWWNWCTGEKRNRSNFYW